MWCSEKSRCRSSATRTRRGPRRVALERARCPARAASGTAARASRRRRALRALVLVRAARSARRSARQPRRGSALAPRAGAAAARSIAVGDAEARHAAARAAARSAARTVSSFQRHEAAAAASCGLPAASSCPLLARAACACSRSRARAPGTTTLPGRRSPCAPRAPRSAGTRAPCSGPTFSPSNFASLVNSTVRIGMFTPTPSVSVPQITCSSPCCASCSTSSRYLGSRPAWWMPMPARKARRSLP